MIAFVDASVLLRVLFEEPSTLPEWKTIQAGYASRLLWVEVGRVIDRSRLAGQLTDDDVPKVHEQARRMMSSLVTLALSESILERAAGPMSTALGTLDAIHLATALELRSTLKEPFVLVTHDIQLARAARASGFEVLGVG